MLRNFVVVVCLLGVVSLHAQVAVLTQHNDLSRTGANLGESVLNVTNVNTNAFGLVYTRPVDDQIFAQPLVATNVSIPGKGAHNLLLVATVDDSVYAFDADDPTVTNAYWRASFTNANAVPPNNSDIANLPGNGCGTAYANISGNFGIISTPVIDPASGTLYVLARTKEFNTNFVQRLHALDITTGADRSFSPVTIAASVPGNGVASVNGVVTFNPLYENQRASLALVNGVVYIAWASHCDTDPYHGWLIGYSETNLAQAYVYCTTPNGTEGAIWMSGEAPAADTNGNIYVSVANGTTGDGFATVIDPTDLTNRGESFLKLTPSGGQLTVASWFTPVDFTNLNAKDLDLGSAGILLIPGTSLAVSGGKEGVIYVVNRDNMGGLSSAPTDTNAVQEWSLADGHEKFYGSPVWWDGPTNSWLYFWPGYDVLHQYQFNRSNLLFSTGTPFARGSTDVGWHPGGILSLSANGARTGTGVLWASHPTADAEGHVEPGVLRAYDAENVDVELWDSTILSRDAVGNFAKFVPPTIANGKVYLATFSDRVNVYGLFPTPALTVSRSGSNLILSWPTNFPGYSLQTNSSVTPGTWGALTATVIVQGTNYFVTNHVPPVSTYYRLKR
jgi:hypothetical protein